MKIKLALVLLCIFSACSDSNDDNSQEPVPAEVVAPAPKVTTHYFGQNGNLWKPSADPKGSTPGNLVVLIDPSITEEFDSCEATLRDGSTYQLICINNATWTHHPFSCIGNGERQTWRTIYKCSEFAEVKITCREGEDISIFTVPEEVRGNVCSRWG